MRKVAIAFILVSIFLLVAMGCGSQPSEPGNTSTATDNSSQGNDSTPATTTERIPLSFVWGSGVAYTAINHAMLANLYDEQGLDINRVNLATGPEAISAIIGNSAQLGAIGSLPLILAGDQGAPIVAVARYSSGGDRIALVAKTGSGITEPKDLIGRNVAAATGSVAHSMYIHMLKHEGIDEANVNRVNMGPADSISALTAGQIDAVVSWEPFTSQIVAEGLGEIITRGQKYFGDASNFIIFHKEFAQRNPEAVKRFLIAHLKASQDLRNDPQLVIDTNIAVSQSASKETIEASVKGVVFDPRILPSVVEDLNRDAAFLMEIGQVQGNVDVSSLVDSSFIDEVIQEFPELVNDL